MLLDEGGADRQDDHQGDDDRRPHVAQKIGNACQGEQQRVQRITGATPDFLQDRRFSLARDEIMTELLEALSSIVSREAVNAGTKALARFVGVQATDGKQVVGIGGGRAAGVRALLRL